MEPWVGLLAVIGFIIFVFIIAIVLVATTKGSSSGGFRKVGVLDLSKWKEQKDFETYLVHQDFMTKEFLIATEDRNTAIIREKGLLRKSIEHEIDLNDKEVFQSKRTGFTMIINKVSALNEKFQKSLNELRMENEKLKSEKSEILVENISLKKDMDKRVEQRIREIGDIHQKVAPYQLNPSRTKK